MSNQISPSTTPYIPPVTNQVEKIPQQTPTDIPIVTPTVDEDIDSLNTPIDDLTPDFQDIDNDLKQL